MGKGTGTITYFTLAAASAWAGLTVMNLSADNQARHLAAMLFAVATQGSVVWLAAWMGYEKLLKDREENR